MYNKLATLFARSTPLKSKESTKLILGGGNPVASCETNGLRWRASQIVLGSYPSERDIGSSLGHSGRPN